MAVLAGMAALVISGCGAGSESALITNLDSTSNWGGQYYSDSDSEKHEPQDVIPEAYYSDEERISKLASAMYNGGEFDGLSTDGMFKTNGQATTGSSNGTGSSSTGGTNQSSGSGSNTGSGGGSTGGNNTGNNTVSGNNATPTPTPTPTPTGNKTSNTDIKPMEVIFYDIGQGDCTLVKCDGHTLLIDCGDTNKGSEVRLKLLQKENVDSLDFLMLTHPDSDHIGGAASVIDNVDIDAIWMSSYTKTNDVYTKLMDTINRKNVYYYTPKPGNEYHVGDAVVKVIAPTNTYDNPNDSSLGIIIEHGDNRFLFAGDATTNAEADILKSGANISANVYKVNHHGSASSTSQAFLDAVNPTYGVISCGKNNDYGHPTKDVLDKLKAKNVSVFRTDEQGTIRATSDGANITWNVEPSTTWAAGTGTTQTYGEQAHAQKSATPTPTPTPTSTPFVVNNVDTPSDLNRSLPSTTPSSFEGITNEPGGKYVLNTHTMKFHNKDCKDVSRIDAENRIDTNLSASEITSKGFDACQHCNPR